MKSLFSSVKRRNTILIIGFLLVANIFAFGLASHYIGQAEAIETEVKDKKENTIETGWQVLSWGYSILEYIKFQPQT